jgi:hypothetical protein
MSDRSIRSDCRAADGDAVDRKLTDCEGESFDRGQSIEEAERGYLEKEDGSALR